LAAQRQLPEARNALEKSIGISPNYMPAIERLVDLDIAEQKFADATGRVQQQIDRDPKLAQPWALRGKIFLAQRDVARAEPDLLKAIELDPALEPAYLLLAQVYVASNKPGQAIEKLNGFVEKKPTVPALILLAGIQEQQKNYPAARDAYEKVLTLAPNSAAALNNLAVLYSERLGQLDKAYELAKKARDLTPNEPHSADTLGWVLFQRAEYRNALPLLQESAGKLPDRAEIQFHLGMAHYMLGQEEPARVALQKAAAAPADFSSKEDARRRLAVLAIPVETAPAAARADLEKYLSETPNDPAALFRLARLQERNGAADEAIKTYGKIIDVNPAYTPAVRQQAILYSQRDDAKEFDLITKARQAYPDDSEIAKWLGIQTYRREYYARAADLLKEAAAKRGDDAEALYYLAESQRQLKQWPACKASLERASSLNLPAALADKAKSALAECTEAASP
jgi:tetratricopeptide (TPR) repeat protein